MKPLHLLIIGSLAVNTVLAGFLIKLRPAASRTEFDSNLTRTATDSKKSKPKPGLEASPLVLPDHPLTWLDIQSNELREFVARLRAAGCPDETIKDIILAEVNRRFAARTREIWPERYQASEYWRVNRSFDLEQQKKQRAQWKQERALQKEKSALLVELLGYDPERQQRIEDGLEDFTNWQEQQISFLSESKREAALKILDEFQDKEQEMYAANRGLWDAQARAEQRQMQADKLAALAQVLSPEQLR